MVTRYEKVAVINYLLRQMQADYIVSSYNY